MARMPVRIESRAEPIPGYKLLERLGGGGFGEVWKAEAPGGLLKAIKFVYGNLETVDNEEAARAHQELRSLERVKTVRHPFILSIERYEVIEGQLLIVTELADRSLWDRFRECRSRNMPGIPRNELLSYLTEAAEALDLMTTQYDLLHLDIKPQNLFLVHNHVKVADFGLVKDLEGLVASVTGGVTPVYAAPETFDGYASRFSDQYSLAIVYQELLTGFRPFSGTNTRQLIMQHLQGKPKLDPLPPADRPIVARGLNREPNQRFPTCTEFIAALKQVDIAPRPAQQATVDTMVTPSADASTHSSGQKPSVMLVDHVARKTDVQVHDVHSLPAVPSTSHIPKGAKPQEARGSKATVFVDRQETSYRHEHVGDGVLMPSLVIGLGQMGRTLIHQLRLDLQARFGSLQTLTHIRLLSLDTDPEALPLPGLHSMAGEEFLMTAKLNRPARYLRPKDNLPPIDSWLDQNILYRMPRNLMTTGIRAFGRLAFVEHFRGIYGRLRRDLEQIADPAALDEAEKLTGLKLRTNFPRVYIATCLAGGTGSGMFLDLAFNVRSILRELGFTRQDIVGLLLLPYVDERQGLDLPHANAHAALIELHHFMVAGQPFRALYETGTDPVMEAQPPFESCTLLPLPDPNDEPALREVIRMGSDYIYRSLLAPLGKLADQKRQAQPAASPFNALGLRVMSSPREPLVRRAARRLAQMLMDAWMRPIPVEREPELGEHVRAHFAKAELDPQGLLEQFEAVCTTELGQRPETYFMQLAAPHRTVPPDGFPDVHAVQQLFRKLEEIMGSAKDAPTTSLTIPPLMQVVQATAVKLAQQAGPAMIQSLLGFMDKPGYRMGATEAAVKQAISMLETWIKLYEEQAQRIIKQFSETAERLNADLYEFERLRLSGNKRKAQALPPPGERLMQCYRLRFQQLQIHGLLGVFLCLRGYCVDQNKDLRFCRQRLQEVQNAVREADDGMAAWQVPGVRQTRSVLLPRGCANLIQAVVELVNSITPQDLLQLDHQVQAVLQTQLPPLAELCVTPGDAMRPVQGFLLQEIERYLEKRLDLPDAAGLFIERSPDEFALQDAIATAYDEAVPMLVDQRVTYAHEFGVMTVPDSPAGQQLQLAANVVMPEMPCAVVSDSEEVVIYREFVGVPLHDLRLMGPAVRQAYQTALGIEHFTPHNRQDITEWMGPN
jgi:serine/threonine protein kinase